MRTVHDPHNRKNDTHVERLSDESKMGILLMLIALVAFGAYAIFYLVGMAADLT